ncbi:MAG: phosphate acyltransferase PlsX [Candidatus Cloacimonetes bacterium]|nr:phosphate acyltransferase PlsX [Candidatus Cloacimonadota bacterium]
MRIALDAFGSDNAPSPEVEGAIVALKENICDKIYLVGKKEILKKELEKYYFDKNRLEIIPATEVISMQESPLKMVKRKKDSSLVKAINLHKEGIVDAVVSAGNTGAVMGASLLLLGRIKNVLRPAIATSFPTMHNPEIILDVGANADCSAENLIQFAQLGKLYYKYFYNKENPEIALLNIGEESSKGSLIYKNVHNQLVNMKDINFVGNIEGKEILYGKVDVVVCDGFVGNVMLKTVEGVATSIFKMLKEQIKKDWVAKIGALLSFPAYRYLKLKMDHTEFGGALLVGLNGISIVAHGSSNANAIKNALRVANKIAESEFVKHAKDYFEGIE